MAEHAWCHDTARDAAVRAAEDGRDRPLPTLGEAIAVFSPSEEGLRTERVTLEIVRGDGLHVRQWPWHDILKAWGLGEEDEAESVRVVDEAHFDDLAQVAMERDAAIREREELKARLSRVLKSSDSMWSQILVVGAERDKLRARVAELEAASNSSAILTSSQAASGGGEHFADASKMVEQPRGWLTEEERDFLENHRHWCAERASTFSNARAGRWVRRVKLIDNLLARSSPPEVVLPTVFSTSLLGDRLLVEAQVKEALAAAGVAVKEVGRE